MIVTLIIIFFNYLDSLSEEETDCSQIINVCNSHFPHARVSYREAFSTKFYNTNISQGQQQR